MSFPRYPAYKDSGVEWLGEVPAHWDLQRIQWLFRRTKTVNRPESELLSVYRDYGVVRKSDRDDNFNKPSEDLRSYQFVDNGDLVLNKMKTWQGSIAISNHQGIVSPAYIVAKPISDHIELRYTHYLLRSPSYISQYLKYSDGIRVNQWDLAFENFKTIEALQPPLSEQQAIAAFLDRETARIDTLIAKQEQMIALLQEKRKALISHAVTRGLDPDVPLKDSGMEWLGMVPAHWEVKRLKHISPRQLVGVVVNPSSYVTDDGVVPFLLGSDVSENDISVDNVRRISTESNALLTKSVLRAGDLVTVRVGDPGVTAVIPPELDGCNCASMMIIRQSEDFSSEWLCYAMNSRIGRAQVEMVQYGAAQKQFNITIPTPIMQP